MSDDNNGHGGFLAGLLIGGLIGAILGLIFAPQPGDQTRHHLRGKLDEVVSLGKSAWEEGKEAAGQKKDELKARLDQTRGKV